jgi:hypothetical protein
MNRMKSLCFPVKGFGGLSLTFSEAFGVIVVVAMVSAIVSSCYRYRFHVVVSSIVESKS